MFTGTSLDIQLTSESLVTIPSMDLPKKKLRNMTGRNTTWGVFKAYVVFLSNISVFSYTLT